MNQRIYLSPPHLSGLEIEYIQKAISSGWLAPAGEFIDRFEIDLQKALPTSRPILAVNSGTSAMHLALKVAGVSKNDLVICQTNTFIATVNPIAYCEAQPIFIDSESESWNMSPELLEEAIIHCLNKGIRPKAIIAVHVYGMPFDIKQISKIAKNYSITLIEDAAEALGSKYTAEPCGSFGDLSVFSFNGNKIITTSAGGALLTKTEKEKELALHLATQAKTSTNEYTHNEIGYNYRISNILAAIGSSQLVDIEGRINRRRSIFQNYRDELENKSPLKFQPEPLNCYSNRWLTSVIVRSEKERDKLMDWLEVVNIETRKNWTPLHTQLPYSKELAFINGNSAYLHQNGLCLPSGSSLTDSDQSRIIDRIIEFFN